MHVLMPKTIGKLFARNVNIHSLQQKKKENIYNDHKG